MHLFTSMLLGFAPVLVAAQVKGTAYGFAKGVTGGGSATAAAPKDITELATWLSDSPARVILIDKTFDFVGSEGTATETGCTNTTCTLANGGQDYIGSNSCTGSGMVSASISYDKAGATSLVVGSNKSIVGVGSKGVIQGKGLRLPATSKNVIIQNVHITNINPRDVWGGDALQLEGNDGVWVDHCKFSKVGRMFVVTHQPLDHLQHGIRWHHHNVSHLQREPLLDCDVHANGDKVTLDRNYWHALSGRAPKLGQSGATTTVQASNNVFSNMLGHAFDAYAGTSALIEGNVFESVTLPMTAEAEKVSTIFNAPDSASLALCSSSLGRTCVANSLSSSGKFASMKDTSGLSAMASAKAYLVTPIQASNVKSTVTGNAGVGKI
ncbi:putative pectin lyase F [Colletotrichum sp. SAR 10_96]|nr:putative pectin lyase F [Colletotrichum sp. SAR 10_96]